MSTVKSKNLQVGTDATASNNFTIYQPSTPDGTLRIGVGNADSPTELARFDSNGYKPAANVPLFMATLSSAQVISTGTWTKLQMGVERYDTTSDYDNTTNYRWTPSVAGWYQINAAAFTSSSASARMSIAVYKNGSEVLNSITMGNTYNGGINTTLAGLTYANGTTDYFECWFYHENGSNVTMNSGQQLTYFDGHLVQRS